jgi:hypothetical protein
MQCRFCLEEEGPMIAPCKCIGSVKYVHKDCLRRWVVEDDRVNLQRVVCNMCRESLYNLEIIVPRAVLDRLLYNLTVICVVIQYLSFIVWHKQPTWINPFEMLQMLMQGYYISLYVDQFRVKNTQLYIQMMINRGSYLFFLLYLYCVVSFFNGKHISMALASNFTFILHWNEHSLILGRINEHLIKN